MTPRKPKAWRCGLCHSADAPHSNWRQQVCHDCHESLAARKLAWCTRGFHRVQAAAICGKKTWCKACDLRRNRKYKATRRPDTRTNRPRTYDNAKRRAYYAANRERIAGQVKARRDANRARYNAQQRAYYAANREREIAQLRLYRVRRKLRILQSWRVAA